MVLAKPRKTWSIISILYVWIHRSSLLRSNTAASLWLQQTLLGRNEQPVPPLTLLCVCRTKTSLLDHVQIFRRKVFSTCFFSSTVLKWINLGQTVWRFWSQCWPCHLQGTTTPAGCQKLWFIWNWWCLELIYKLFTIHVRKIYVLIKSYTIYKILKWRKWQ